MQEERIKILVSKHLSQSLTRAESDELEILTYRFPALRQLLDSLDDEEALGLDLRQWARPDVRQNLRRTWDHIHRKEAPLIRNRRIKTILMSLAAAAVLGAVIIGLQSLPQTGDDAVAVVSTATNNNNIAPAAETHATLTLIDRSNIQVDSLSAGKITEQNNSKVIKQDNGAIAYIPVHSNTQSPLLYNTLTVLSGGQASLILPDQTRVWLNNMSSLRYPVAFKGASREVFLKGEAYFEVSPDSSKPFHVQVNGMKIDVLGTHFTVTAYANERGEVRTTLLEGKLRVNTPSGPQLLHPGEQLIINGKDNQLLKDVDADEATAWKEGYFHFSHADIHAALRQLSRWYGLEVDNRAKDIVHIYDGEISRSLSISDVLKNLENDDVHFKVENKKIIVTR